MNNNLPHLIHDKVGDKEIISDWKDSNPHNSIPNIETLPITQQSDNIRYKEYHYYVIINIKI